MSETRLPGLKSGHQVISPTCRSNHGTTPAFLIAAERLQKLYDKYARAAGGEGVVWHLVLVREDPAPLPPVDDYPHEIGDGS